jgi:four helix bundle protein
VRNGDGRSADGTAWSWITSASTFTTCRSDFLVFANEVIETLPRGRSHLADQFTRASTSIVLNLAEGAGKISKPDKRRYYLTARGSATESAALLDVCFRLKVLEEVGHKTGKEMLIRIVSMLIKLAQACEE